MKVCKLLTRVLTDIVASSLPVFIDEFTRGEHPVVMQFFVPFCGHFVSNFYFTVKLTFRTDQQHDRIVTEAGAHP